MGEKLLAPCLRTAISIHGALDARRSDQHSKQETDRVGSDVALSAHDLLPYVDAMAGGTNAVGGLTLWVSATRPCPRAGDTVTARQCDRHKRLRP